MAAHFYFLQPIMLNLSSTGLRRPFQRLLAQALAGLALLATAAPAQAQTPTFAPVVPYSTGSNSLPVSIAVADVNGDGKPDLLTANSTNISSTAGVLLGNGTGTFQAVVPYSTGTNSGPISIAVADVSGDGKPDLLTANSSTGTAGVLLGNGNGTFQAVVSYSTGPSSNPYSIAVADVNGDGKPDLLTANAISNGGTAGVLLGNGNGTFQPVVSYFTGTFSLPISIAVADVNGDGKPDLLTANSTNNTSTAGVLLGNGNGTFQAIVLYSTGPVGSAPESIAVADVNGDGKPDLLTANSSTSNSAGVLLGNGNGTFQPVVSYSTGTGSFPISIAVADVNGDGKPDLLTANNNTSTAGVLLGNGNGTFQAVVPYSTGTGSDPYSIAVADVNGDGKPDLLTANLSTSTAGVLLNTTVFAAPTLTSLSPTSGPVGTSVTLTGTDLTNVTGVSFNGTAATVFSPGTGTTATATVPAGAGTGNVTVTTAGGTSNGVAFTVVTDLVVSTGTQLAPTTIPAGNYNSITITNVGNGVLAGNVSVATFFTVQPGGGLSDGCSIISGAGTFTLGAGSILGICSPQGITASGATGSVQVTGTRSFSTAANYGYNTNAAVTGNGLPATVASLAINTAGNVTLSNPVAVSAAVGVGGAGNLLLNGNNLTLLSSAIGTALARNSSTGVVVGTATVQRFIASANTGLGYRHYSAPVSGSTVGDLATAGFTPEISQAATYNASATPGTTTSFPNVFGYDQSRVTLTNTFAPFDRGFVVPSAATPQIDLNLTVGRGYAVNIAGTQLVDFVGTLNTGAVTRTLARNAAGTANESEAGWHLVGNPYPAPIDYSLVAPANTGLENAMYVFESAGQYTGTYRSFVAGIPAANRFVGTAQGFFVRVLAGQTSGSLNFQNNQRVTDPTVQVPFRRDAPDLRPLVQLDLRGATGPADTFYAYAQPGATPAFDAAFDARKLPNTTGLNLASLASTGESLSIDGRPAFAPATALALTVGVPAAGTYTLVAADLANLPAGLDAFLTDAATGQTVNLRTQPSYAFAVMAAQAAALLTGRFTLAFGARTALAAAAALTAAEVALYPNPAHGAFAVQVLAVAGATAVQATLLNALGQAVRRQAAALSPAGALLTVETAGLAAGVYTLRLQVGTAALAKRVVIQ